VSASSEFREYENGVADVLASIVGEAGTVQRNVRLPSRSDGRPRQIDVLVEGDMFGLTGARMVVDCKRWGKPIDAPDVERFIGTVEDVGADLGIPISAEGASDGAIKRAQWARGVRVKALSVVELNQWRPAGTVSKTYEIPHIDLERAMKALREAGLRVVVNNSTEEVVHIEVFRHHGTAHPSGEIQHAQHELADATLDKLGLSYRSTSQGVSVGGGTPYHRWLPVLLNGVPVGLKVLAADEAEADRQLGSLAESAHLPKDLLSVERPDGWPFTNAFLF
jgi:hypothetical protein